MPYSCNIPYSMVKGTQMKYGRYWLLGASLALSMGSAYSQTTTWVSATDGDWLDGFNWTNGTPTSATQAIINAVGAPYEVGIGFSSPIAVGGITLNSSDATLLHTFGDLDLGGGLLELQSGVYRMVDARLMNAVIEPGGGLFDFDPSGGVNVLENITIQNGQLVLPENQLNTIVNIESSLAGNNGSLLLRHGLSVVSETGVTVSNLDITTELSQGAPNWLGATPGSTLVLDADSSYTSDLGLMTNVHNQGTITAATVASPTTEYLQISETFTNDGVVHSPNAGRVNFRSVQFTNSGSVVAENGSTVRFDGILSGSVLGDIQLTDSRLELVSVSTSDLMSMSLTRTNSDVVVSGGWNNNGSTYTLNNSTGDYTLEGGGIIGGALVFDDGAALEIGDGSNFIQNVSIASGTLRSSTFGRVVLNDGWQSTTSSLTVDGARIGLGGSLAHADLSSFTLMNDARIEVAGELDLGGSTLSPISLGGDFAISGGEVSNGVLDFSSSPLVFEGVDDQLLEGSIRDATVRGGVVVESGRGTLTGNIELDNVTFSNRSATSNAMALEFVDIDLAGTGFAVAEGTLGLDSGSDITNGTIQVLSGARLELVDQQSTITGTNIDFGSGAELDGRGTIENVTLSGTPTVSGNGLRFTGLIESDSTTTFDAGLGTSINFRNQSTLTGDFVGIDSTGNSGTISLQLSPNANLTLSQGSTLRGVDISMFDNGSDATLNIDGAFRAEANGALSSIDVSTINVAGLVEVVDGGEMFLGSYLTDLAVTGSVRATDGGIMYVSGQFSPGEIDNHFEAPTGTMAFAGEILNADNTLYVDSRFDKFALGHREEARVYDGGIQTAPGSALYIGGLTFLYDVDVVGDVIAENRLRLESGSNIEGTLTARNSALVVAFDPDPISPAETYSVHFEDTNPNVSRVQLVGHDRAVEFPSGYSVSGTGGTLEMYGTQSSLLISGNVNAVTGQNPLTVRAASTTLGGTTLVENNAVLQFDDAQNASADGDSTSVYVPGTLRLMDQSLVTITGDVLLDSDTNLFVSLTDLPNEPLVAVSDTASLSGSFWLDTNMLTSVLPGESFTLIEAAGIVGTFDVVSETRFSLLRPEISIDGTNVVVHVFSADMPTVTSSVSDGIYEAIDTGPVPAPSVVVVFSVMGIGASRRQRKS